MIGPHKQIHPVAENLKNLAEISVSGPGNSTPSADISTICPQATTDISGYFHHQSAVHG